VQRCARSRHQNGTRRWSTVGASTNIIEASWRAMADSLEYALLNGSGNQAKKD
jgi:2-isopropylmalate synthase